MSGDYQQRVLRVLADPTRYRIVQLTCEAPQQPRNIAKLLGLTSSAVYQHLNALLETGFIERIEVENRVHYRAKPEVPPFLQKLDEACTLLREGRDTSMPSPIEPSPQTKVLPSPKEVSSRGGILDGAKSSLIAYYSYSPFWSLAVTGVALVDLFLAAWCLVYALLFSPNPALTVAGGLVVCSSLAAITNYLYQRTRPPPNLSEGVTR